MNNDFLLGTSSNSVFFEKQIKNMPGTTADIRHILCCIQSE